MKYFLIMTIITHHYFIPNDVNITKTQYSSSLACEEARGQLLIYSSTISTNKTIELDCKGIPL